MDTCKKYTGFEKNQVLTAGQLNITFDYLENEQRSTHREMIGIGAACGFKVSRRNGNKIRLFLSKGWGNTSYGYHLSDVDQEFAFVHNYQDPTEYTPFKDIKLLELLKESIDDDETVKPLNMQHLSDYVVIIFLETQLVDLENCTGTDCDEKGKQHQHCLKKLLVSKADYIKMMQVENEQQLKEKVKGVFLLPSIALLRPFGMVARAQDLVNTPELYNFYRLPLIQVRAELINGLKECYRIFNPILRNYGDTVPFLKSDLSTLFFVNMESTCGIQYFYDFVEDLILAYNEFKEYAFHVCGDCLPDFESFPKHLAVGDVNLTSHCVPTAYRQYFIKSAIMCCGCGEQEKLLFLFRRLYLMISQFKIHKPSDKNVNLKLTPSREKEMPLSLRAIPYYYSVRPTTNMNADWLQKNWSFERTQHCETKEIMSYHAGLYVGDDLPATLYPLKYSLSRFNHIRIEGLVGKNVRSMYDMLIEMLEKFQIPIKVIPVKLADTFENGLNVTQCRDNDMEVMYDMLSQELLCWMKKLEDYFAGLRIRHSRPKYIPGRTGVRGIVRDNGEPVPGVWVVLDNSDYYDVTDEKGEYFFESAKAEGYHTIRAYGNGYQGTQEAVNIQKEKTVVYNANIQKMPEYTAGKVVSSYRVGERDIRHNFPENIDADKFVVRNSAPFASFTEGREGIFSEDFEIEMEKESLEVSRMENELRAFEVEIKDKVEMKAMPSAPKRIQILPEIEPLQAVGKDTVAEIYNDYLKGDFELEEYINTMMGESVKKDACRLPEELVMEVFYPLKVLDGLKQISRVIPESFQDFEPAMLLNVYGNMLNTMENYKHTIYGKKVPLGKGIPSNPDHVISGSYMHNPVKDPCCDRKLKIIEKFQDECRFHTLTSMKGAPSKRTEKMQDRLLFKNFIKEHPGIEHMAGAPKGGTFVMVYDREEKVVADFALPYISSSDCPPIMFCETMPIFFQLVKKHFCSNDNGHYKFMINVPGGKVVGKGVTFNKKTGEYFFTPSTDGVKVGINVFVYEYQGRSFEFEATVYNAEASFTYDVVEVLPDDNIARVVFYAYPNDAERYTYNFGDGTSDVTVDHPQISHDFNTTNLQRFTVKLSAIINDDCKGEIENEILIDTCTAEFKPVKIKEGKYGVTYQFVPVKEAESHHWKIGVNRTSNEEKPIRFFLYMPNPKNYTITHEIEDKNCQASASEVISVPATIIRIDLPDTRYYSDLEIPQPITTFPINDQVVVTGLGVKPLPGQKGKFVFVPALVPKNVKKPILTMELGSLKTTTEVKITRASASFQKIGPKEVKDNPEMVKYIFVADDFESDAYRWDFGNGRFGSKPIETMLFPTTDIARKQKVILKTTLNQYSKTQPMELEIPAMSIGISIEEKELCPNDPTEIPIHLVPGNGIGQVTGHGVSSKGEEWFLKASDVPEHVSNFEVVYQVGKQTSVVPIQMIKVNADFTIKDPIIDNKYTRAEVSVEPLDKEADSYTWEFVGFPPIVKDKTAKKSIPLKSISQDITIKCSVKVGKCTDTKEYPITLPGNKLEIDVPFTNICAGDTTPYVVNLHPDDPKGILTPKMILTQDGERHFVPSSIPSEDLGESLDFTYKLAGKTIKKTFPVISGKFSTTEPDYNKEPGKGYVKFTAVTKNADSYIWDFPNGKTVEGSTAEEYFVTSETTRYPVSLTVKKDECRHTFTQEIEIKKASIIIDVIAPVVITDSIGLTEASISTILTDSRMEFLPRRASEMITRAKEFYKGLGKDIASPEKREMLINGDLNIKIAKEIGPFLRETRKLILESEGEEGKTLSIELYRTHLIQVLDIMAAQEKEINATSNMGKIVPMMTNDLTTFKEKRLVVFDKKTLTAVNRVLGQVNLRKRFGKELLALKEVMK